MGKKKLVLGFERVLRMGKLVLFKMLLPSHFFTLV